MFFLIHISGGIRLRNMDSVLKESEMTLRYCVLR